jgi:hypothetical protein
MELLKCGQCGDRPGLLMTVADCVAGIEINLCYKCYKNYARHVKDGKAREPVAVVYEEGVSAR